MRVDPGKPYQDLPPLPPAINLLSPRIVRQTIAASRALATANTAAKRLPNPSILIHAIPLLEARASSEIENIVTTNDELFRAASNIATPTPATREALNYREALYAGLQSIQSRPLSINTAKLVCSKVTGITTDIRADSGTYIGNPATHERIYTPPEGKQTLLGHLSRWEGFLHEAQSEIDPLIKMALLHYQFEAIHPFRDGNGRTGRILNVLYLVHSGLLEHPITYLSGYIVEHKDEYYRRLNGVTQNGEWESWVKFMLEAVEQTSRWTDALVTRIYGLMEQSVQSLEGTNFPARDLAYLLFTQPYLRYADLMETMGISRPTAAKWATALVEMGLVVREKVGRHVILINHKYLEELFNTPLPQ